EAMKLPRRRRENPEASPAESAPEAASDTPDAPDAPATAADAPATAPDAPADTSADRTADATTAAQPAARSRVSAARSPGGLRNRMRRFLQQPGTVELTPYRKLLPQI